MLAGNPVEAGAAAATASGEVETQRANSMAASGCGAPSGSAMTDPP
ncbi:hypothetical protein [Streptomyces sp. PT12]|nr:hypothetical protein [Streptomyces sp. PT12]